MKRTPKYFRDKYLELEKAHREKINALRLEAEEVLIIKHFHLMNKPVKVIGQKGWNIGLVTNVRLAHDFTIVIMIKGDWYTVDKITEPSELELKKFYINNGISLK